MVVVEDGGAAMLGCDDPALLIRLRGNESSPVETGQTDGIKGVASCCNVSNRWH